MHEIVPGIFTWSWFSERHGYDFNGHLICHAGGNLCVDPVEADAETWAQIRGIGVARIVLTNRNHLRAATALRASTGARVAIHPADAGHAQTQGAALDDEIAVGGEMGPFEIVEVPGKSPGEIALHWRGRRLLIVGDAIVGNPPGRCTLLAERVMDDPPRLRKSVRSLLGLDFDVLLVGDGRSILRDAKARVQELVECFPPE
jgi:glyoxylase-like metal-dependent hydrolase (beta-lactamase superfamily II)